MSNNPNIDLDNPAQAFQIIQCPFKKPNKTVNPCLFPSSENSIRGAQGDTLLCNRVNELTRDFTEPGHLSPINKRLT